MPHFTDEENERKEKVTRLSSDNQQVARLSLELRSPLVPDNNTVLTNQFLRALLGVLLLGEVAHRGRSQASGV